MPNAEGTGKRLVRRPHPPPTTAPLPDDFDAITETRESTTIYDDATNSALGIDYDDITIAPAPAPAVTTPSYGRSSAPPPIHAPVPISPPRNLTSPLRQHRPSSPSHSIAGLNPDVRGSRRSGGGGGGGGDGMSVGKARSVVGDRDRDRERTAQRRSLGTGNAPVTMPAYSSGKGPAKGRNDLVEKLVIEDGPERTISVWREHVAKKGTGANVVAQGEENGITTTGGGGGGGGGGGDGDGRSELDSHVGRRRVSTDSRRRVESLVQSTTGSPSVKGKGHRNRESAEFTEVGVGPGARIVSLPCMLKKHTSGPTLGFAAHIANEVFDAARQRQWPFFAAHDPAKISASRGADVSVGGRTKRNRVQRLRIGRIHQGRIPQPGRIGPLLLPTLSAAPVAHFRRVGCAAFRAHDRFGANA